MQTKKIMISFMVAVSFIVQAQKTTTIEGHFALAKNDSIKISAFDGLKTITLSTTLSDSLGNFKMSYPSTYTGAAILQVKDKTSAIVLLNKENFTINWNDFNDFSTLQFENSPENDAFVAGIKVVQESENILAGLKYLAPLYSKSVTEQQWIQQQITEKEQALPDFLKTIPATSYAAYYLTIRKLLQDMPLTANRYIERMPDHEKQFAAIDFSDSRLLHSGLLKDLLDGFYLLLESYGAIDTVATHANAATTALLKSLDKKPALKQEVAEYLFKYLEKRSLFKPAEFVAKTMLNARDCSLDANSTAMYEQYRKMGIGQKAPNIVFNNRPKGLINLSSCKAKLKLVIFGSSECPRCQEEFTQLTYYYPEWKDKYSFEIIFIALDTDAAKYAAFTKDFPWISMCDYKGWKTKSALDYSVFATPTMYLLDSQNTILLKPSSAGQINSWLIGNGTRF